MDLPSVYKTFEFQWADESSVAINVNYDVGFCRGRSSDFPDLLEDPAAHRQAERGEINIAARQVQQPAPARRRHRHSYEPARHHAALGDDLASRGRKRFEHYLVGVGHDQPMFDRVGHEPVYAVAEHAADLEIPAKRAGHQRCGESSGYDTHLFQLRMDYCQTFFGSFFQKRTAFSMIERHATAVRRGIDLHHSESSRHVELNDVLIDLLVSAASDKRCFDRSRGPNPRVDA
jgi:hypothetical protein